MCEGCFSGLTALLSGTDLIPALLVAYVAWQQWRLERQRFRFELFEKRMAVFKMVHEFVSFANFGSGPPSDEQMRALKNAFHSSHFIFSTSLTKYIEDIYDAAVIWCEARDIPEPIPVEMRDRKTKSEAARCSISDRYREIFQRFSAEMKI